MNNPITCARCGKVCQPDGLAAGYGVNAKGEKHCYECCAELDREAMRRGEPITLYVANFKPYNTTSPKGPGSCEVTNWPGTLRLQGFSQPRRHNMSRNARSVWAWFEGRQWFGTMGGTNGDCITMRPTKTTTEKLNRK